MIMRFNAGKSNDSDLPLQNRYPADFLLRMRLFILFFAAAVSVASLPCGRISTLGLFGEVKSSTVTEDCRLVEAIGKQAHAATRRHKGTNVMNLWYELRCGIVCMIFAAYVGRLREGGTLVTLKVRMDN